MGLEQFRAFLDVVLQSETADFTWYHLFPLARRVMEESAHQEEDRRLWGDICARYSEEAPLEVVHQLLMYETDKSVSLYGMETVMDSSPFHRLMLQKLLQHWSSTLGFP